MFRKARRLHFVGIGGTGMSGIAEVLVNMGYRVTGSDLAASDATRRLKSLGARVRRGHQAEHVHGADVVVISSAVREDNPEVIEARRLSDPGDPPRRDARRVDAHEVRRRGGRRPRQDHDDRADRRGAGPRTARPDGGDRRPSGQAALGGQARPRRADGRRGGRVGRLVPEDEADHRGGDQHRPRTSGLLRRPGPRSGTLLSIPLQRAVLRRGHRLPRRRRTCAPFCPASIAR